ASTPPFPYTTLFRSGGGDPDPAVGDDSTLGRRFQLREEVAQLSRALHRQVWTIELLRRNRSRPGNTPRTQLASRRARDSVRPGGNLAGLEPHRLTPELGRLARVEHEGVGLLAGGGDVLRTRDQAR